MNVVDSSGWLEFFADSKYANFFEDAIEDLDCLVVPVVAIYEVYKRLYSQKGRDVALEAIAYMQKGRLIDMDVGLAIEAAELSVDEGIPMADSSIYVLARSCNAILWTQDYDLKGLEGVKYQRKIANK